jgi:hypothetical protein
MILNFKEFTASNLNEGETQSFFPQWKDGGILLIRGIPQRDGLTRLYATRVRKIAVEGLRGFSKAYTYQEFYVIGRRFDGSLSANKFLINPETLKRAIGINSFSVGLNAKTGKTPLWRDSIKETDFKKFLGEFKDSILSLDDIFFPSLNS